MTYREQLLRGVQVVMEIGIFDCFQNQWYRDDQILQVNPEHIAGYCVKCRCLFETIEECRYLATANELEGLGLFQDDKISQYLTEKALEQVSVWLDNQGFAKDIFRFELRGDKVFLVLENNEENHQRPQPPV